MTRLGLFVARRRRWVLAVAVFVVAMSVAVVLQGATLRSGDQYDFESGIGSNLESAQLPHSDVTTVGFIVTDPARTAVDPRGAPDAAFAAEVRQAFTSLTTARHVRDVTSFFTASPLERAAFLSGDRHSVIVRASLTESFDDARANFQDLRAMVGTPNGVKVTAFGDVALASDFDNYLGSDLARAEVISIPLSILLLVLVFRSVAAALVSVAVGVAAVVGGLAGMFLLARVIDVSPYAENIVSLIGLGVAIDYSLFIVSRFREELSAGRDTATAVGAAVSTAGRAIVFSGLTVALGLVSLCFFRGTFLVSMGLAGAIVVAVSVLFAVTLLPAILALLGPHIDWSPWGRARRQRAARDAAARRGATADRSVATGGPGHGAWHALATWVMRRPLTVLAPCLLVLVVLGSPFRAIHLVSGSVDQLPVAAESRQGAQLLTTSFPTGGQSSMDVLLRFSDGQPVLSAGHLHTAYAMSARITALGGLLTTGPLADAQAAAGDQAGGAALLAGTPQRWPATVASDVHSAVGADILVVGVTSTHASDSDAAHTQVQQIRAVDSVPGASTYVTGDTAYDIDFVHSIVHTIPVAVVFAMTTTALVLFLLLGSVLLPLKAVVMNLLSLSASFGAMVWVFQQGHLSGLLGFAPAPIDPTIPVLLFCIVFGLSMDYEVFLLTRMQEEWHRHGDNRAAVAMGLERSGRIVTGAAAIMLCVFISFGLAQVIIIKAIGAGMAIAVLVDATIVRALVVPAVMRLMGRANWWAPTWLAQLHERLGMKEAPVARDDAPVATPAPLRAAP